MSADEDGEDGAGQAGDYDDDDDEEEDEDGSEGGEVGLSFQVNRADQVGNSGFGLQVDPHLAQTQEFSPLPQCTCPQPGREQSLYNTKHQLFSSRNRTGTF